MINSSPSNNIEEFWPTYTKGRYSSYPWVAKNQQKSFVYLQSDWKNYLRIPKTRCPYRIEFGRKIKRMVRTREAAVQFTKQITKYLPSALFPSLWPSGFPGYPNSSRTFPLSFNFHAATGFCAKTKKVIDFSTWIFILLKPN